MNIVEAHEKGHGLRDFTSSIDRQELRAIIDPDLLRELTDEYQELERTGQKEGRFRGSYVEHPDEIIERMAQFKNYFGMGPPTHLPKSILLILKSITSLTQVLITESLISYAALLQNKSCLFNNYY